MRSHRIRDVMTLFFDPRVFPLFVIGSLALAAAGNGVYALLVDWLGDEPQDHLAILVVALLVLLLAAVLLSAILRLLRKQEVVITNQPNPQKRRGLIFLVSQEDTLAKAFQYHRPELTHCWLICSEDSLNLAKEFKEAHEADLQAMPVKVIADPFDWRQTQNAVNEIYRAKPEGWSESDIITDISGLTKLATTGAILACLTPGRPLQYVPAIYEMRGARRVPIAAGDPIEIIIDYGAIKP
ncbi:hypothetical protein L0337_10780 [candidate division KSB1 bacterium]|nr:hypothetical protein [candidate division KSB1 bacterium]